MRRSIAFAFLLVCTFEARAQTNAASAPDQAAIKQTALDYIEGWYEGNAERMERALHPELEKRIVRTNQERYSPLDQMSAMLLALGTGRGAGTQKPKESEPKVVSILEVFENSQRVKV